MRYRDLETGTFLTRDPIGYADGPNVYCYVHCNPITRFDPLGLVMKYETPRAEEIANYILEHGSDQNKAELQYLIADAENGGTDLVFTMTTTEKHFNSQSKFTPDNNDAAKTKGEGSFGVISIETKYPLTEFSIESSAAHEVHHAYESAKGEKTEDKKGLPGYDTDGNGFEDNEDRATDAQRAFQKANGVPEKDQREDYGDAHKGWSPEKENAIFLKEIYGDGDQNVTGDQEDETDNSEDTSG